MDLRHVLDHLAILNLYAAYAYAVDNANAEDLLDCYTPDAVADFSSFAVARKAAPEAFDAFCDQAGVIRGAENLRKSVGVAAFHHVCANVLVRSIAGDRADSSAYFVVFTPENGAVEHYGRYDDELTRCRDGKWRIARRVAVARYERDHAPAFKR